jgi:high-affinity iron transporter
MGYLRQLHTTSALIAVVALLTAAPAVEAQERVGKRLSAIVGVAVEEYAKGVDEKGRVTSVLEFDEATGFLREAKDVALRLTIAKSAEVRRSLDSLSAAADRRVPPTELKKFYDAFSQALGAEGALDMPTRAVSLARGRTLYEANCASCHGVTGGGGPAVGGALAPPPIGRMDAMRDVTPALTYRIVSVGIQGTPMKGFTELTADDRWDVVAYVNSLRSSDAERLRGRVVLSRMCPDCDPSGIRAHNFEWQAQQSDAAMAGMLRAGDPVTGLPATAPLSASEADAIVSALRAAAVITTQAAADSGAFDPRGASRNVLRVLDDALGAFRAGRTTDATDLAFDAYIAFEPLETNARMHDPALVARMEREFADFLSALKANRLDVAESHRSAIEREMPAVVDLAVASSTKWGAFLESFIIILREGFEAILVLGAIVAFLIKTGHKKRVRDIWIGGITGLVASLILALLMRTALAAVPASVEVIEGITLLVAVVVLFSVSYWLLSKVEAARWQEFIKEKVTSALSHGGSLTLGFVAFLAVFREGAETALFFQALLIRSSGTVLPIVAGVGAGGVTLTVVFSLFYRFGVRIPLRPFFAVTSGLLYWMALVFAGKGIKELQEGGVMTRTPIAGFPFVDPIGLYPTVETLLAQVLLIGLLLFALWRTFRPLPDPNEGSAHRAPLPVVTSPPAPMPPEVAARLAELQVTAKRLQERVETLEREVEHDPTLHGDRPK